MEIEYININVEILFEKPIYWKTLPTFLLRGILGAQLRSMVCIQKQAVCETCLLSQTCSYSFLFESPIEKNGDLLPGRNKISHPFVLSPDTAILPPNQYRFNIILFGNAINYLPYIYFSFQKAGEQGLFSDKIHFSITSFKNSEGINIIENGNAALCKPLVWRSNEAGKKEKHTVRVECLTPLRMKTLGVYRTDFDAFAYLSSMNRRIAILSNKYCGEDTISDLYKPDSSVQVSTRDLKWVELDRYSKRQESKMSLGGVKGSFIIEGILDDYELSILRAADIFHAGKNTVFGLGKTKTEILD